CNTSAMACLRPSWASEITRRTPLSPRRTRLDRLGIQPHVGVLPVQGAVAERGHLLVQLLADAGDLTLADAFQAQGLHQVVHLPGADAVAVSLLDDGQQGPFGPPAWLQEAGEVAPLPQPRDSQRNG